MRTETDLRDRLIDRVIVGNLRHRPEALFSLFRQFTQRVSLPRLIHFFDLVLPQLMPVQAAWADEGKTLWSCHHIRYLHTLELYSKRPRVKISYLFTSHDDIHHVRIRGMVTLCYSSQIPTWYHHVARTSSKSRPAMSLTNNIFKWVLGKGWRSWSTTLLGTPSFKWSYWHKTLC